MEIPVFPPYIKLMILDITLGRQFTLKFLGVKRADSLKIASNITITSSDYSFFFFFFQFKEPFNTMENGLTYFAEMYLNQKFSRVKKF